MHHRRRSVFLAALAAILVAGCANTIPRGEPAPPLSVLKRAVVRLLSSGGGWGSAVCVHRRGDQHFFLTAAHCVRPGERQVLEVDGRPYASDPVLVETDADVAFVSCWLPAGKHLPTIPIASYSPPDSCVVTWIGFPAYGLRQMQDVRLDRDAWTVDGSRRWKVCGPIAPGVSGGPVVYGGRVVGIVAGVARNWAPARHLIWFHVGAVVPLSALR